MAYDTGDIIIWDSWPGHVAMAYSPTEMIHANNARNFHKVPFSTQENGTLTYAVNSAAKVWTCPWSKCGDAAGKKLAMQTIADAMLAHAKYGKYRALRLFAGSSLYGGDAHLRFQKYRDRQLRGFQTAAGQPKFVSTITCAEAVILCLQLTFPEGDEPFFIRLDSAHTMPDTLATWLTKNWGASKAG